MTLTRKATVVKPKKEFVSRDEYMNEKVARMRAEKVAAGKLDSDSVSSLSSSDLSDLLSSDEDSSSSSSSDSVRSLGKKIKKLETKKTKLQKKELENKWLLEHDASEKKRWKKKELFVDQELYTRHKMIKRDIMQQGGAKQWIKNLFNDVRLGRPGYDENIVWKIVSHFAVVMFVKDVNKDAAKASDIIDGVRRKHNIDENEILEVVLDDSKAGKVTYINLQRLTAKKTFPQIFVNETFIGGLEQLKDFAARGLLLRQVLIFQGIVDRKCHKCIGLSTHRKLLIASQDYDEH